MAAQSPSSLDRIEGMSKKRAETLPYAALVLHINREAIHHLAEVALDHMRAVRQKKPLEALPLAMRERPARKPL